MNKFLKLLISIFSIGILGFIYYYVTLPALNIHSVGFWFFMIGLFVIVTFVIGLYSASNMKKTNGNISALKINPIRALLSKKGLFLFSLAITCILIIIFIFGSIFSSQIFNSKKYREIINISERDFTEDIKQISYNEIPILDKDSASMLGSRKMCGMVEYVSQFEISDNYTQINYKERPVRVTPLKYGSLFKWFTNHSSGIPAYINIDMATQEVSCIKLAKPIKYSEADHFGRNIYRHLRFKYPTYIFDKINFEIDDEGNPYWICPVKDFSIGLFGGQTIKNVVIINAVTGEDKNYDIKEVPTWIDKVYSADLLISYYNYYGTLKHGYWNTVFSQKDCLKTTDGYNYIALDNDVWVYTGITSVGGDESNIGFVLMNQRTAETRYYAISGAEEYSAMASAEGKVQELGYRSTFPLLLNIANEPTYFIALKDASGLVKKYAMVNIAQYQTVAIGDTVSECEKSYIALLKTTGITSAVDVSTLPTITGTITKIAEAVVEGNSHYYILLSSSNEIFDVSVADYINIIKYNVGDMVTLTYSNGTNMNTVLEVK